MPKSELADKKRLREKREKIAENRRSRVWIKNRAETVVG
jgi:hypothetical protein